MTTRRGKVWNGSTWVTESTDQTVYLTDSQTISNKTIAASTFDVPTGFRNVLINGDFRINQRGASSYASSTSNVYTVDRWAMRQYFPYTTGYTLTRTTGAPAGFAYCVRLQRNSGTTGTHVNVLEQNVETVNSIPLQGQTITISAWMRKGANFSAANSWGILGYKYGKETDEASSNSNFTNGSGQQQPFALTTSWQRFSVTYTMPSDMTQIAVFAGFTGIGTAGTNDYMEIAGYQVERGSVATPFEFRPFQQELALCQRYYYRHATGTNLSLGMAQYLTSGIVKGYVHFPVTMRIPPAIHQSSGTNYYCAESATGGTDYFNAFTGLTRTATTGTGIYADTGVSGTAGQAVSLWTASDSAAYVGFNAEL